MCVCVCVSVCVQSFTWVQLLVTSRTIARQASLSMGFSRQEYWSGLPCPPPGDWEVNRQEGQGSPKGGNRLQVSLKILCCYDDTSFHLNSTFFKPWAKQYIFLMEMFFLSCVNETMYLLWNLPFFKMVPPKTNFWLMIAQQYSYQLFYGWGMTHLVPSYLKNAYCGRGAWWNSISLEMSLLSDK